ncbi:AGE family epimerase/isomerase [Treponema sp. OMZ 840]|uniref:AGE family epimerase/isomerase n=1 Tax=Treponema sp. OMZ 840 TaxID=244313 RepID=UPI003D9313AE
MKYPSIKEFYLNQIQNDFFPYWIKFIDNEKGGILNCINNYGDKKISDNKFTWSQGRWLWILCCLYKLVKKNVLPKLNAAQIENWAEKTWRFISTYCIMDDTSCCYLLTRDGVKIKDDNTGRFDASIYADCFALIGIAQYAQTFENEQACKTAQVLYKSIKTRIESHNFLTEPYPIPDGYKIHGIPMILVNTIHEYTSMLQTFNMPVSDEIEFGKKNALFIVEKLMCADGYIREFLCSDKKDGLLDRHINPGHTIEDLWFLLEFFQKIGCTEKYLAQICKTAKRTWHLGWDKEYGGLLRFVDYTGGKPQGTSYGSPYENLILNTWDMKLWWPHSETLFTFILLYKLTGDSEFKEIYETSSDYIFKTFPNKELGEWIQIRSRNGLPEEKLVALPVKDPFHILRNYIKITELL